jgi:hypothetical protein
MLLDAVAHQLGLIHDCKQMDNVVIVRGHSVAVQHGENLLLVAFGLVLEIPDHEGQESWHWPTDSLPSVVIGLDVTWDKEHSATAQVHEVVYAHPEEFPAR